MIYLSLKINFIKPDFSSPKRNSLTSCMLGCSNDRAWNFFRSKLNSIIVQTPARRFCWFYGEFELIKIWKKWIWTNFNWKLLLNWKPKFWIFKILIFVSNFTLNSEKRHTKLKCEKPKFKLLTLTLTAFSFLKIATIFLHIWKFRSNTAMITIILKRLDNFHFFAYGRFVTINLSKISTSSLT